MLLIEIILTIFAWRNGWKSLALIPIGVALLLGFFIGLGAGSSGGDVSSAMGMAIVLDVIAIIVLAVMCFKSKKSNNTPTT